MASERRHSKFPKVNRDIPRNKTVETEREQDQKEVFVPITSDAIRALLEQSRQGTREPTVRRLDVADSYPDTTELSIRKVLGWVDGDATRASHALESERNAPNPRVTLIPQLEEVISAP